MPTYTYTFTDAQNQSDTLTVQTTDTPDGGPYSVTSISGTVNGQAITGLDETYAGPDNTIGFTASYLDGVDGNGVSFDTADGDSFNLYSQGGNISLGDANVSDAGVLTNVVFTQEPACYLRGTRIATPAGERTVEALRLGDLVLTHDGAARPVRWIGRRTYAGRFLAANPRLQPVRFRAGSIGERLPRRDLLVSGEHAMFLDGMLIPARCLINGSSVVRERRLELVEYLHVELESHDVLLAEGAPAESFIDDDSRGVFHNAAEFAALYPAAVSPAGYCAPRVEHGAALDSVRRRLAAVARELGLREAARFAGRGGETPSRDFLPEREGLFCGGEDGRAHVGWDVAEAAHGRQQVIGGLKR